MHNADQNDQRLCSYDSYDSYDSYEQDGLNPRLAQRKSVKSRFTVALVVILCALAVCAAFIGITYSLEIWGGIEVPETVGLTQEVAQEVLSEAGFNCSIEEIPDDGQAGIVLWSTPSSGERAEKGSKITIGVSRHRRMPQVVGKTYDEAVQILKTEGLTDIDQVTQSSDEPEGLVLSSSPQAGEEVSLNSYVVLTVATPYRVPDVVGMQERSAVNALEEAGFSAKVTTKVNEDVEVGVVISMDPAADSASHSGSVVTITCAVHRSDEITSKLTDYLNSLTDIRFDGKQYEMIEVKSLRYDGGDTYRYSLLARAFEQQGWGDDPNRRRYGAESELNGTIRCSDDGSIISSDPQLEEI